MSPGKPHWKTSLSYIRQVAPDTPHVRRIVQELWDYIEQLERSSAARPILTSTEKKLQRVVKTGNLETLSRADAESLTEALRFDIEGLLRDEGMSE